MVTHHPWYDPRARWALWVGLALSAVILVGVVWAHSVPLESDTEPRPVAIDPVGACSPERVGLACARWQVKGWPCTVQPGGALVETVYTLPAGAHAAVRTREDGRQVIGLPHDDVCATTDATLEHEIGHLLGLPHGGRHGSVMAPTRERVGLEIPQRVEAAQ